MQQPYHELHHLRPPTRTPNYANRIARVYSIPRCMTEHFKNTCVSISLYICIKYICIYTIYLYTQLHVYIIYKYTHTHTHTGIAMQVLQYLREFDAPAMQSCKPLPCGTGSCQNRRLREQTLTRKPYHCGSIKGG